MFKQSSKEEILQHMGYTFKYILKKRKYDNNNLIIVFSGFGGKSEFTYDFLDSLKTTSRSAVLWLKDDFFDNNFATYYMDTINSKGLETSIISFIDNLLSYLELNKNNCTLLGCSKGGAAALYYGIKYNFKNILVSAPTLLIGSSISGISNNSTPRKSAKFIMNGEISNEKINALDCKIIDLLNNDQNLDKNIFLLSSKADPKHKFQVEPFIDNFKKYANFNYIESKSCLVRSHQDVTFFNAPLILSIINCLSFNLNLTFINNVSSGDAITKVAKITKEPFLKVNNLIFDDNGKFHPEGIFFLRGLECKDYKDLSYQLIFKSNNQEFLYTLARDNKPSITKDYYLDAFVNYDKAFFCTTKYQGLSIDNLAKGTYKLFIKIKMRSGEEKEMPLKYKIENKIISKNKKYELFNHEDIVHINVN